MVPVVEVDGRREAELAVGGLFRMASAAPEKKTAPMVGAEPLVPLPILSSCARVTPGETDDPSPLGARAIVEFVTALTVFLLFFVENPPGPRPVSFVINLACSVAESCPTFRVESRLLVDD